MDPASASLRVIRALSKADDVPRGVIRAYHGSPHSFSRFDASKIGTGEGAQAYGHGLYFAGAEDTARTYRDISPAVPSDEAAKAIQEMQQRAVQLELEAGRIRDAMEQAAAERGALAPGWGTMRDVPQDVQRSLGPRLREIGDQLSALRLEQQSARSGLRGHMYEVELGVPEESLLDWDAPISDQTNVRQRLGSLGDVALRDRLTGRNVYELMQAQHGNDRNASSVLTEFGIPGIQYFDAGSRSQQQGTRNYVMFPGTEDRIRILRQYGLLPPLVGAAAMQEE
jgi:hypothetical protein